MCLPKISEFTKNGIFQVCDLPEEAKELGIPAFRLVMEVGDAVKENILVKG